MGGKVTALGMDVITEKSGHVVAPIAPSVCLTPAAPSPLPVPYPATGTSREGVVGAPSRTKVNGAPIGTVGGAFEACHGNEPGALKEIVSHNTGGAVTILIGAPNVVCELGMMGITGSPVLANKGPGGTMRCAPAPMMTPTPGMGAGTAVCGGGIGAGGGDGDAADDGEGGQNANGENGGDAPSGQPGQRSSSDPVDVVTGRAYTLPAVDLALPGPLPLTFARVYATTAAARDVGMGFGWASSWSWELDVRRRAIVVWSDQGIATHFPKLDVGTTHVGAWGWTLRRERERFVLDVGDGPHRFFAATDDEARTWKLIAIRDRNDNQIELSYDDAGRLCELTDSAGRTIGVETTSAGRIASIQIKNTRAQGGWIVVARYSYDEQGNLAAAVDAEGHTARYQYDDEHRLTCRTDRCGLAFRFAYDRAGRCVEGWGEYPGRRDPSLAEDVPAVLADGRTRARGVHHVRLDYGDGRYTEVADSTQVSRYFGNRHGLCDKQVVGGAVVEAVYDARGLVLAEMDGEHAVTRYERDAQGRVTSVVDPLGRATRYHRDERGDVIEVVDPAGRIYRLFRDGRGNVIHEADATGAAWSYEHDPRGLVTSMTSPTGGVTRFAYDAEGNLVERVEPTGGRWRWAYDALGRCVEEIDPLDHATRVGWTARGDVAVVRHADASVIRYVYDGERRRTEIHGPGRRSVAMAWGGFHKLVARTDPNGAQVAFRYDREGQLVEVVNELGERHRLRRNGAGLLVREETFDGRLISYKHDKAGHVVREDVAGEITTLAYNAAGELISRTLADETEETLSYDARGELTAVAWPGGTLRLERDAVGRVLREVQTFRGQTHTVESLYDKAGERVRRLTSRGYMEQIERDETGARVRTILDEIHDVHHARDALGRESVRALPRGGRIHHEHDPMGRLSRRRASSAGSLRPARFDDPGWSSAGAPAQPDRWTVDHEYRYDAEGERSDALDRRRGWLQYDYDPAGRLTSVLRDATGEREAFAYDPAGNPLPDGVPCAYGAGGCLLRRGKKTYESDAGGRLREMRDGAKVTRYAWDVAGRLSAVTMPDGRRVEYGYDPFGRRLDARTYDAPSPTGRARLVETTRFVWDADTIAHAIRIIVQTEGDIVVEERTFCFEDGGVVPWAQCDDGPDGYGGRRRAWSYFVNDPIGTPEEMVDGSGVVVAELDREAWGKTVGGERTPLRFQGQYEDGETGLFYNRFRDYDADAGLYLSPDPIGLGGGLRLYGYGINPTGWVDPLGLSKEWGPSHAAKARADELHALLAPPAQWNRTTAVVETKDQEGCPQTIVASSKKELDPKQMAGLLPGEHPAEGLGHAEVKALALANNKGWTPIAVAASGLICPPCKDAIDASGARAVSRLR
jgi:RHS repeat-associated protein